MDSKERILEVALELFLTKGYENTSMRLLAETVGLTKPGIYHHFPGGKENLALEVVSLFESRVTEWLKSKAPERSKPLEFLSFFFRAIPVFAHIETVILGKEPSSAHQKGFNELASSLADDNPQFRERIATIFAETRSNLTKVIRSGIEKGEIESNLDPEALAWMIHSIAEGMGTIAHFDESIDLTRISEQMLNQFLGLVTVKTQEGEK